ncbi:FtsW/RodA/SpoVE family cell cycle protein [Demequina litorisediminis]|uniref:FtsW/RodA/SpoVE family cell cycle protein n=1 Tax=Demequina litorisediminis TaxID=1849022 RepID=UPI0024E0D409|nr:FtsW/RodA/SpoVE family cell cycle protein [Demequina litorisediminis]
MLYLLPLVPGLGITVNGARIWISIGGNSLQPGEFAKIALVIFFAGYLVTNRDTLALAGPKVLGLRFPRVRDMGPLLIVWAAAMLIMVYERDLGASLLFFSIFLGMLYVATQRFSLGRHRHEPLLCGWCLRGPHRAARARPLQRLAQCP